MNIYILPTQGNAPCRALLFEGELEEGVEVFGGVAVSGVIVQWSSDLGTWTLGGTILPAPLSEAITAHAKNLGVEW